MFFHAVQFGDLSGLATAGCCRAFTSAGRVGFSTQRIPPWMPYGCHESESWTVGWNLQIHTLRDQLTARWLENGGPWIKSMYLLLKKMGMSFQPAM